MIKKVVLSALAVLTVVLLILVFAVAMQPNEFQVTRSAVIDASPDKVFEHVNDFQKWQAWSPWEKMDPNMQRTYAGPPAGAGASYSWKGNDEVGEGKMTIAESDPGQRIKIDLDFVKPFESKNVTEFTFKPEGDKTAVSWTMTGRKDFVTKAVCMVMDMDKMIGNDFETGLTQLRSAVETAQ